MKTAILVDGGFYRRRSQIVFGEKTAVSRANELDRYCRSHLTELKKETHDLYRIFYYDCPPMERKVYHPYLRKQVDFSCTDLFSWMNTFLNELRKRRKFALRLGRLAEEQAFYSLKYDSIKKLCNGSMKIESLCETDFAINVSQKGVDMKIGIDIASLAYKKQVDQIVLISGDSDFVPAAKLARREGIDFILDPMRSPIKPDLMEHIDGLRSIVPSDYLERRGNQRNDGQK
jgi:uncharacterized LabA/DUF88 family protein